MQPDQAAAAQQQQAFPDLSELASSFDTAEASSSRSVPQAPPADDTDPASIWASVPSTKTASTSTAASTSGYNAVYVTTPPPPPPPEVDLRDFDPYAPGTLGSTVRRGSRLEIMDNSGSESGSPTEERRLAEEQGRAAAQLGAGPPPQAVSGSGSGYSFGNVLRSISGTPSRDRPATSTPPPHPHAPSSGAADATRPQQRPATPPSAVPQSAHQTPTGPSGLAKPLASIASVFRSTGRSSASSSSTNTPQPGSSPQREKGSFMTAIVGAGAAKGKDKERAPQSGPEHEKGGDEMDEKGGKGKGRERAELLEPVFDFNKFLEQMRTRTADPIAKYLRSFLKEFSRRPPVSTNDQVRVINDFLDFIAGKMRTVDPWKSLLDVDWRDDPERAEAEFDLTLEAMEKLVMNRLWHLTFSPALDLSAFPGNMSPSGDVERDEVLKQRIRLFSWIEPKHLDLPIPSPSSAAPAAPAPQASASAAAPANGDEKPSAPVAAEGQGDEDSRTKEADEVKQRRKPRGDKVEGFLDFAQRELRKMNQYKAPRDKLICVLNCCKVIFGLIRHVSTGDQGADAFIPFLIYVVIKANPEHLVSNLQYIQRFRNPEKLSGEGGYYLSSLNAAISFIESLDASSLSNITQDEFESKVAAAVKEVASEEPPPPPPPRDPAPDSRPHTPSTPSRPPTAGPGASADLIQPSEAASASLLAPAGEGGVAPATPSAQDLSFPESMKASLLRGTDSVERAMSKPLGALARVFEQLEQTANELTGQTGPAQQQVLPPAPFPPAPGAHGRPGVSKRRSYYGGGGGAPNAPRRPDLPPLPPSSGSLRTGLPDQGPDPAMYAPEEETDEAVLREIDRQHEQARLAALETLQGIFPDVEREVLEMVLLSNSGDMGKTIDSLLEMTATPHKHLVGGLTRARPYPSTTDTLWTEPSYRVIVGQMKALPSLGSSSTSAASPPPRPATGASALVSSTTPPASEEPSPTDLLLATPPTLLKLFALSAPVIHVGATFVQLVTWTHPSFFGSLLVLLSWWALCLFGYWVALYGLNAAVLVLILHKYLASARKGKGASTSSLRHRQRNVTLSPAAYTQLINSAHVLAEHVQVFRTEVVHPLSQHFSLTPLRPSTPAPAYDTAWFLVTSYPFYLVLTFLVPLRYLFLLAGTVGILWQAPFFTTLRALLWRSAFVRWLCRLFVGVLRGGKGVRREWARTRTGLGIPGLVGARAGALGGGKRGEALVVEEKPVKKPRSSSVARVGGSSPPVSPPLGAAAASPAAPVAVPQEKVAEEVALEEDARTEEGEDVQVQFTVFENQRWWVGLDWTHALLPGERASWTDPDNNPANPPASFVLPPPSVAYVASPTKADPHSRLKKTTEWRWLDPEWHVLRSAVASVTLPVGGGASSPVAPDGSSSPSTSPASAGGAVSPPSPTFSRTLGQIAASAVTGSSHSSSTSLSTSPSLSLLSSHSLSSQQQQQQAPSSPSFVSPTSTDLSYADSPLFAAWSVDDEGWQYGDNHFDKMGPRGGLGKYTRRRAWVRRAGLVERTERVPGATAAPALPEGTATAAGGAGAASVVAVKKDGGAASARDERKSGDRSGASPRRRSASGSRSASSGAGGTSAVKSGSGSSGARRRTSLLAGGGGVAEVGGEGVSAGGG